MADRIYGLHQSQPKDVYDYIRQNVKRLGIDGRVQYRGFVNPTTVHYIPEGIDMLFDDTAMYDDKVLMDGRTRRYSVVKVIAVNWSLTKSAADAQADIALIRKEMAELGYKNQETLVTINNTNELAAAYSVDPGLFAGGVMSYGESFTMLAGVPTYTSVGEYPEDAPFDGEHYSRQNGKWVLTDQHDPHGDVDGGEALIP